MRPVTNAHATVLNWFLDAKQPRTRLRSACSKMAAVWKMRALAPSTKSSSSSTKEFGRMGDRSQAHSVPVVDQRQGVTRTSAFYFESSKTLNAH